MDISVTKFPIARKLHRCSWCDGEISIGKKYEKTTIFYDGSAYDWKNHTSCRQIAEKLKMWEGTDSEGLSMDDFWEHIKIEYQNIVSNEFSTFKNLPLPSITDQLNYVKKHYKIDNI